jgi:hypothetical protein
MCRVRKFCEMQISSTHGIDRAIKALESIVFEESWSLKRDSLLGKTFWRRTPTWINQQTLTKFERN